jgi:hypothetical protein
MSKRVKGFMELLRSGTVEESRAIIEAEKAKSKYFPDAAAGNGRFTKRGKPVEKGNDGIWRPVSAGRKLS